LNFVFLQRFLCANEKMNKHLKPNFFFIVEYLGRAKMFIEPFSTH
jgi:hypothetical protein